MSLTVKPGSRSPRLLWVDGELVIAVRERALEGAANDAVSRALAAALAVPLRAVVLRSGLRSRRKRFLVTGLDSDEALARLRAKAPP